MLQSTVGKAGGSQHVHDFNAKKLKYKEEDPPMPKIKTHRGAAKRFGLTKSGKIKRGKAYKSHILTKKSTKRKTRTAPDRIHSRGRSKEKSAN